MKAFRTVAVAACCLALLVTSIACKKKDSAEAGAAAVSAVKVPDTADQVINQGVAALKNNKPVEVFAMLPPSYQNDIQSVVNEATSKMDKELFELGVQILDKVVAILDKHGDMLAGMAGGALPVDAKEAIAKIKQFHGFLKQTKLVEFDTFKSLNVAGFLSQHGSKLMGDGMNAFESFSKDEYVAFRAMLDGVSATVKSSTDDTAEVELKVDDETETVTFQKVEGRWVPADMAEGWVEMIADARKNVGEAMGQLDEGKEEIKGMLTQLLTALTEFEKSGDMSALESLGQLFM